MVVFPGWLQHFVEPYRGTKPRVSISCNVLPHACVLRGADVAARIARADLRVDRVADLMAHHRREQVDVEEQRPHGHPEGHRRA
jgi:hypothetical protein